MTYKEWIEAQKIERRFQKQLKQSVEYELSTAKDLREARAMHREECSRHTWLEVEHCKRESDFAKFRVEKLAQLIRECREECRK